MASQLVDAVLSKAALEGQKISSANENDETSQHDSILGGLFQKQVTSKKATKEAQISRMNLDDSIADKETQSSAEGTKPVAEDDASSVGADAEALLSPLPPPIDSMEVDQDHHDDISEENLPDECKSKQAEDEKEKADEPETKKMKRDVFLAKKSTTSRTPKKRPLSPATKLHRELKLLETNSRMKIDEQEIVEITSRKRHSSANSLHSTPEKEQKKRKAARKAGIKIQMMKREADEDFEKTPSNRARRTTAAAVASSSKCTPEVASRSKSTVKEPVSKGPIIEELNLDGLTVMDGKHECVYCFSWIKLDDFEKYFSHMKTHHPEVKEEGWAFKPPNDPMVKLVTPKKLEQGSLTSGVTVPLNFGSEEIKSPSPLKCEVCDQSFKLSMQLKQHLKKVHGLLYCCGMAFDESSYSEHQVMHELAGIDVSDTTENISPEEATALEALSSPLPSKENVKPKNVVKKDAVSQKHKKKKKKVKSSSSKQEERPPKEKDNCKKCIFAGTENMVYKHYLEIHGDHWCLSCKKLFPELDDLEDHFNEEHSSEFNLMLLYYAEADTTKERSCSICNNTFVMKGRLLQHYKVKHNRHPCFICTTAFNTVEELKQHGRVCVKKSCTQCKKKFTHAVKFLLHQLQHIDREEVEDVREKGGELYGVQVFKSMTNQCTTCKQSFSSADLLAKHKEEKHPEKPKERKKTMSRFGPQPVKCKKCDREFSNIKYLEMHKCSVPEKEDKAPENLTPKDEDLAFCCEICGSTFSVSEELNEHLELHCRL